jgi:hypothetical protein
VEVGISLVSEKKQFGGVKTHQEPFGLIRVSVWYDVMVYGVVSWCVIGCEVWCGEY